MKLKYYMRGLGIGIAVTALLMGIAFSGHKETMTDEEIRQRALEMGMTDESGVLADDLKAGEEEDIPEKEDENAEEVPNPQVSANKTEEESQPEGEVQPVQGEQPEEEELPKQEEQPKEEEQPDEVVIITVNSGDGSRTVSNKLKEAGLIDDADYYDRFLCQNGYDKRLASGSHEIPIDASDEEIARLLMQRPDRR